MKNVSPSACCILLVSWLVLVKGGLVSTASAQSLPLATKNVGVPLGGTAPLTWEGDLAAKLVDHVDQFLLRELGKSVATRASYWQRDTESVAAYVASIESQRQRFRFLLGARDPLTQDSQLQIVSPPHRVNSRLAAGSGFDVYQVRWEAFGQVQGTGLLLRPTGPTVARVIALPDCEITPEQLVGLDAGVPTHCQYARRLASAGCEVVVPMLINRQMGQFDWGPRGAPKITNREMLYRSAFELGRGLIAYEVQKVLAAVQCFPADDLPTGVIGWGEGGLVALYSAALATEIDAVCVSGYFGSRQNVWQEPLDRNVFGLLREFGDAEIASLVAPRPIVIEPVSGPVAEFSGAGGGAPARLVATNIEEVEAEVQRARDAVGVWEEFITVVSPTDTTPDQPSYGSQATLDTFLHRLGVEATLQARDSEVSYSQSGDRVDVSLRHRRQMRQLDEHTQQVLRSCAATRKFFGDVDTTSAEAYTASIERHRNTFYDDVIGRWDFELKQPKPRTRLSYETDRWLGYEVVLDVFEEVFAYGILLVPKDIKAGERRPVVVCQHGLEGRPQDTIGEQGAHYYAGFAGQLADRGYVTFAPQNLYIGRDRFRTLQRKSYPLQKTLFSIIVPQHQQIVDWLQSQEFVDPERVAFYGLSYGGKTAMRVPPLVTDYCLSICSADFNEWVDKNASTQNPRSYVWTGEYEIFEFDLGSTFNYAEMAGLIAPRPFMVERGHGDGVADDWTVAWEFAKVRTLYAARLKLPRRCEIEWFDGPHKINGKATFEFLDRHLRED